MPPVTNASASGKPAKPPGQTEGEAMLEMMRHATGADRGRRQAGYRNYYCAGVVSPEADSWRMLVGLGLAEAGVTINEGRDMYFVVSPKGLKLIGVRIKR